MQVLVNLANVYQFCEMYTEAVQALMVLVKNKTFDRAGRLRINIGNIYFVQGKHLQAVKQFRMALDQIPSEQQELRYATKPAPRAIMCACVCVCVFWGESLFSTSKDWVASLIEGV